MSWLKSEQIAKPVELEKIQTLIEIIRDEDIVGFFVLFYVVFLVKVVTLVKCKFRDAVFFIVLFRIASNTNESRAER